MKEVNNMLPMLSSNIDIKMKSLVIYLKENLECDIYEKLKCGYCEMSQINLTLAELGLEEDMLDLCEYEISLGCDSP